MRFAIVVGVAIGMAVATAYPLYAAWRRTFCDQSCVFAAEVFIVGSILATSYVAACALMSGRLRSHAVGSVIATVVVLILPLGQVALLLYVLRFQVGPVLIDTAEFWAIGAARYATFLIATGAIYAGVAGALLGTNLRRVAPAWLVWGIWAIGVIATLNLATQIMRDW